MNRLLVTEGRGSFKEIEYKCSKLGPNDVKVRSVLTGICRSDIDMMVGKFGPLPVHMSGHEGLGQVIKLGSNVNDVEVGEFVATRGEPAYADVYVAKHREFVVVPEAHPKYILEPIACGINCLTQPMSQVANWPEHPHILIIGSGFLAQVAYQAIRLLQMESASITVVGSHSLDRWKKLGKKLVTSCNELPKNKKYDVILDLATWGLDVFGSPLLANNGLYILAAEKHPQVVTSFASMIWGAATIICPSPRHEGFYSAMCYAATWVRRGILDVDGLWTQGYSRDTQWQQAFADGLHRPPNYSRGYLDWRQ